MSDIIPIISSLLKYIFITIIYLFIFAIIKMVYQDIKRMNTVKSRKNNKYKAPYLELLTDKENLYFDVKDVYPLDKEAVTIGRDKVCSISVDDLYMSATNTELWFEDGEWYISDLESTNGTYINGERMTDEPLILDDGDRVRIGQLEFLVVLI